MELGVVIDSIAKITETFTSTWLDAQLSIYNTLSAYNIAKTVAFPNDPTKLKCYVPTRINSVEIPHPNSDGYAHGDCNVLDDDTLIFRAGGTSATILNTHTISSGATSDDITPASSFSVAGAYSYGTSQFFKTTTGYAWVSPTGTKIKDRELCTVQYTNDNFATITTMTQYSFSTSSTYTFHGAIQDGNNILLNYINLDLVAPTYLEVGYWNQYKIVDVTYNTVAGSSSIGTELIPSFNTSYYAGNGSKMSITENNVFIKQFGDYSLIYGSYGYKTGYFLVDLTNTDPYWYHFDPVLFGLYSNTTSNSWGDNPYQTVIQRDLFDIKKIGSVFYFVFGVRDWYASTAFSNVSIYKMETV